MQWLNFYYYFFDLYTWPIIIIIIYLMRLLSYQGLHNFSTARKSGNISSHTEKLFSSDTRQSMKRRIAIERLSKIYIARCRYTWLDESKWPQEWPISPITIIYLKIPCVSASGYINFG